MLQNILQSIMANGGGIDLGKVLQSLGVDPKQVTGEQIISAFESVARVAQVNGSTVYSLQGALKGKSFHAVIVLGDGLKIGS